MNKPNLFFKYFKDNCFQLSFGIAIIVIGIITIFWDCNDSILIGISISSIVFSILNIFNKENSILNFFPLFIILLFGFFFRIFNECKNIFLDF